jgi:hypothetical protein
MSTKDVSPKTNNTHAEITGTSQTRINANSPSPINKPTNMAIIFLLINRRLAFTSFQDDLIELNGLMLGRVTINKLKILEINR